MTLEQTIARQLAASNVGLFRKQIFDRIDKSLTVGNIEKVSLALNAMKVSGYVEKSARQGTDGSRWSITPKGRAAFSAVNDDELHGPDMSPEQVDEKLAELSGKINQAVAVTTEQVQNITADLQEALTEYADRFKSIEFDTSDELDRGLFGIVELIRSVAGQPYATIQGKAECIAELEKLENADFLANKTRAVLTRIRLAIEELEDEA